MLNVRQWMPYESQLTQVEQEVVTGVLESAASQIQAMKYISWLFLGGQLEDGFRSRDLDSLIFPILASRRVLECVKQEKENDND